MLDSMRAQLKISEIREKLNGMLDIPADDAAKLGEREKLTAELKESEVAYRKAVDSEELEEQAEFARRAQGSKVDDKNGLRTLGPEHRERMEITGRANVAQMFADIVDHRQARGAEAETQSAWGSAGDEIPMALIATELRTIDAPDTGSGTGRNFGYVFGPSIADAANIVRPSVQPGQHVFPSFTSGAAATRPAIAAENADQDPIMRGQVLTPKRVQSNANIAIEDRARLPGMSQMVTAHLRAAVIAGLDAQALSDDDGFFDTSSGPLTPQPDPGSATTWAEYSAFLTGGVDGRHAVSPADVTLLMNGATFVDGDALFRGTNTNESAMERIARLGRLVVSAAMPAAVSNIAGVLVVRGRLPAAVQPVWANVRIEDVYTDTKKGLINYTIVALADFSVVHPSAYQWKKANVS